MTKTYWNIGMVEKYICVSMYVVLVSPCSRCIFACHIVAVQNKHTYLCFMWVLALNLGCVGTGNVWQVTLCDHTIPPMAMAFSHPTHQAFKLHLACRMPSCQQYFLWCANMKAISLEVRSEKSFAFNGSYWHTCTKISKTMKLVWYIF